MHLIQEIGSYAGFAAVVGLAVLAALYFSQARDVKRLREWAGRAPERAAEAEVGGRPGTIAASRAPQPRVTPAPASPAGAPAQQAAPAAAKQPAQAGDGGPKPAQTPAPAQAPAPAQTPAPAASPVPAASPAARGPAVAAASAGVATATPETGAAPSRAEPAQEPDHAGNSGTATGAKVLPPRPSGAPRPTFTRASGESGNLGNTAVMKAPLAGGRERRLPPPRYLALIVAGLIVLGVGAAVGVIALTDSGSNTSSSGQTASNGKQGGKRHHKRKHKNFPPAIDPSSVTVAVLNGTNVPGLAAKEGGKIQSSGFKLGNVTNASRANTGQRTESVVMFKAGENRKARAVARKLGISQIEPVDAQTSTLSGDAAVVVVVGADQINR